MLFGNRPKYIASKPISSVLSFLEFFYKQFKLHPSEGQIVMVFFASLNYTFEFQEKIRNVIKDSWKTISFKNHGNMQTKLFFWVTEKNITILSTFTTCEPSPDKYTENSNSSRCIKAVTATASAPGISGQKFLSSFLWDLLPRVVLDGNLFKQGCYNNNASFQSSKLGSTLFLLFINNFLLPMVIIRFSIINMIGLWICCNLWNVTYLCN